jgi:carboxymethylenebutenolidase
MSIKTADVTFSANGVEGMGYLAQPDQAGASRGTHPGVIVIQEWWGLDGHIRDIAERYAREGFVALAPDMYHGKVATEPDEARKLVMSMNREQANKDLLGALTYLQGLPEVAPKKIGVTGFCMGGALTLWLATASTEVAAAAPFYAGFRPGPEELAKIEAEMFCAFGADDGGIPLDAVKEFEDNLRNVGKNAVVKVYEGAPHSFFNDTKESYRPAAAKDAWEHSLDLFRRTLVQA